LDSKGIAQTCPDAITRHHFDPPHRVEPDRLAESLKALWSRAGLPTVTDT
jgi:hypothetical protein